MIIASRWRTPPAMPRISHPGQHRQQARRVLSIIGKAGQMADSTVNRG
jgi:hypothetical protein